jgi:hypothetical protein
MQALISQHIDTRLQSFTQTLEEAGIANTDRFTAMDADVTLLRADL